ncbi:MAG: hypothetical protein DRR16_12940 [Candidatus Parabeggiatoa sp. nov. 3]|nr:MAG: hypothetical protein DRR00_29955 [Gammaproteobacteria bacterium]RKZ53000.1 MAG: hypothetical protein DRQ99_32075 [Gammaproteobacteria bacterium]RKZ85091.1 MAG: hypothetical protein DRR16_12940 [Gammaproteobacteria bacterium]HEW97134.1 OmpA family protein [Beggiatoa sp.]
MNAFYIINHFKELRLFQHGIKQGCLSSLVILLCSCQTLITTDSQPSSEVSPKRQPPVSDRPIDEGPIKKIPPDWSKQRVSIEREQPEWKTQVALGNEAAQREQWREAASFYNRALDLIEQGKATPSRAEIENLYRRANKAELIADTLNLPPLSQHQRGFQSMGKSMENCGSMRSQIKGVQITRHLKAVHFEFDRTTFTAKGDEEARQLAACFQEKFRGFATIKFIGHTDKKGGSDYNCHLSKKRAKALKNYLQRQGVTAHIVTEGRGEDEPLHWDNPNQFTGDQLDAFNRRVEIVTLKSGEFSETRNCRLD